MLSQWQQQSITMQVFSALQVLVLLLTIVLVHSKTEDISSKNIVPEAASKDLDPASSAGEENSDAIRKKKSATTTLCVEIRPSDPYQRPFQVCEPATAKGYAPAPGYYPAPSYEEAKPVTPKPAAAYDAPVKTYSAPAKPSPAPAYSSSKPYAAHSPSSYSSVSYRSEDGLDTEEVDGRSEEVEEHMMRSAGDYGMPLTYLQPAFKHKQKKGHNGLVITCQPSLAGYAAAVPAPSYGGGPYGGYRAAARSYNNHYERPNPPKAPQGYGYAPAPAYKAPAPVYKVPPPSYPSYPSYKPQAPSYGAPVYRPAPIYRPSPAYSAPAYAAPAPPPAYKPYYPAPAPVPAPAPSYPVYSAPPAHPPQPYSYQSGPSYVPAPPPPPPTYPAPAKVHPQPAYVAPGTYRAAAAPSEALNTEKPISAEEKEKHTIRTMEAVNNLQRAGSNSNIDIKFRDAAAPLAQSGVDAKFGEAAPAIVAPSGVDIKFREAAPVDPEKTARMQMGDSAILIDRKSPAENKLAPTVGEMHETWNPAENNFAPAVGEMHQTWEKMEDENRLEQNERQAI